MVNKFLIKEIDGTIDLFNKFKLNNNKNFDVLVKKSISAIRKNCKIIFYGNGGSASDAQHLATELTVRFKRKRRALPAISLASDNSAITAIGNDIGFEYIFSRQIEAIGNKGDIAIAITTSGNSKNLIKATMSANKKGIETFCFAGNKGGRLKKITKYPIIIPSNNTSQIQVIEILIGQVFCQIIENFFKE